MKSWFKSTQLALALWASAFFCLPFCVALETTKGASNSVTSRLNSKDIVTIISYNLQNYFVETEDTVKPQSPKDLQKMQAAHNIIVQQHPHILAIQEIGGPQALLHLQKSLTQQGLNLPHAVLYTGIDTVRQQALLSKYPIVSNNSTPYWSYKLNGQHLLMNRGILDISLQTPLGIIRCLGVHLKSQRFSSIAHQKDIRYQETLLLKRHIQSILTQKANTKLIVLGDFNDTLNSKPIKLIKSIKHPKTDKKALYPGYSMTNKSSPDTIWTQYWEYQGIYSKFDYIWVSSNLTQYSPQFQLSAIKESLLGSDHRACILKLSRP